MRAQTGMSKVNLSHLAFIEPESVEKQSLNFKLFLHA
jgi:hypothetical protein